MTAAHKELIQDEIPTNQPESFFHYYSFGAGRYIDQLLIRVRREVFECFMQAFQPQAHETVLDVGASADDHVSSNYLEKHYPYISNVTALSNYSVPELETQFPGLRFVEGDGRALPFSDGTFDYVFSHAVIEHVGSRADQTKFISELFRVAKKGVVFSTPNRWHPIEPHTGLPFVHYLPPATFRSILTRLGKDMYNTEEKLNLLTRRELREIIEAAISQRARYSLSTVKWLGLPSNFVAMIFRG